MPETSPDHPVSIEGCLAHVVFHNPESGFTIARLEPEDAHAITIKGLLPGIDRGEFLRVLGKWVEDPRYGRQLRVDSFLPITPQTPEGLERLLSSARMSGIGPVFARRLVQHFGEELLEVLDNAPQRLREVEGIGSTRSARILASWREGRAHQDTMIFLRGLGVAQGLALRILRRYQEHSVQKVRENPYRLAVEIRGVGFLTADRIARELGIAPDSPHRLRAGLVHVLVTAVDSGHCFLPRTELLQRAEQLLGADAATLPPRLDELVVERALIRESSPAAERLWLPELYADELHAAERLLLLTRSRVKVAEASEDDSSVAAGGVDGLRLTPAQSSALDRVLENRVVVVTGGPGTGKTTLVRSLLDLLDARGLTARQGAPTGRAAKRMEEATGRPAKTLHRLLEFSPREGRFLRDEENPLAGDVLIVDEASMIDLPLFRSVLGAVRPGMRLVLVGDVDQLPSVGPGRVLQDVIDSGSVPVVRLDVVFRQDETGLIVRNAHGLLEGRSLRGAEGPTGDFFIIYRDDPAAALRTVVHLVTQRIPARWNLRPGEGIQVLAPMRKGTCGSEALNHALRAELNPRHGEGDTLRPEPGDRVMQIQNDYDKDVFNGDAGWVLGLGTEGKGLRVRFDDGREIEYPPEDLPQLRLAYAITIHKSQGSEYPAVVVPILTQHYRMLQRNLLYTAITRGKEVVVLVGSRKAIDLAVANVRVAERWTGLAARLAGGLVRP
ncbi:MAG: ATP-dependent RecD-like DNA helicase [Myxococcota bacterium]|nr:ATP-dependent RecD-like DNA helicase [Myxococcota bacterium]